MTSAAGSNRPEQNRNFRLQRAIFEARITPEQLAESIEVDPKTVERWITQGRIPYPRHQHAVAVAVGVTEADLWPEAVPTVQEEFRRAIEHPQGQGLRLVGSGRADHAPTPRSGRAAGEGRPADYAVLERRHRDQIIGGLRDSGLSYEEIRGVTGVPLGKIETCLGEAASLRADGYTVAETAAELGVPSGSMNRVLPGTRPGVGEPGTVLKSVLRERHLQTLSTFQREYDKAAAQTDPHMVGHAPGKAQFYRWLSGNIKQLPYPDHCRVLEAMLPGYTVEELFAPDTARHDRQDRTQPVESRPVAPVPPTPEFRNSTAPAAVSGYETPAAEPVDPVARMRALMSWVDQNAPVKEREIHGVVTELATHVTKPTDRRRSR